MKLMGAPRLFAAAASASLAARGACASLRAELEAGNWTCTDDVSAAFPSASWSKNRIIITLDDALAARVAFNFERGIALIDIAHAKATPKTASLSKQRRSA